MCLTSNEIQVYCKKCSGKILSDSCSAANTGIVSPRDRQRMPVGDGAETYLLKSEGFYCLKEDGTRHEESAVHYFDHMEIDGTVLDGFYFMTSQGILKPEIPTLSR